MVTELQKAKLWILRHDDFHSFVKDSIQLVLNKLGTSWVKYSLTPHAMKPEYGTHISSNLKDRRRKQLAYWSFCKCLWKRCTPTRPIVTCCLYFDGHCTKCSLRIAKIRILMLIFKDAVWNISFLACSLDIFHIVRLIASDYNQLHAARIFVRELFWKLFIHWKKPFVIWARSVLSDATRVVRKFWCNVWDTKIEKFYVSIFREGTVAISIEETYMKPYSRFCSL